VAATPFEASAGDTISVDLECLDCKTYGDIEAEFNDDGGLHATLTFNNVGAYLDFGAVATNKGSFSIGLGRFFNTNNVTVREDCLDARLLSLC
jgi:hypothetical protein